MLIHSTRPMILSEVSGQPHIVKELKNRFTINPNNNENNSYKVKTDYNISDFTLLEGPSGTGKNSVAYIMAKLLLCTSPVEKSDGYFEPCNQCASCTSINSNKVNNSFTYYDGSRLNKERVERIARRLNHPSVLSSNNIIIIDEAQNLATKALRSSFLTIADEPLSYGYLILCTMEPEIFDKAFVSRFNRFKFNKISVDEILHKLTIVMEENDIIPPDVQHQEFTSRTLPFIAKSSDGSLREAINLLEKCNMSGSWTVKEFKEVAGL